MTNKRKSDRSKTKQSVKLRPASRGMMSSTQPSPSRSSSADSHACPAQSFTCESCAQLTSTLNKLIDKVTNLEKQIAEQSEQIAAQNRQIAAQQHNPATATTALPCTFDQQAFDEWKETIEERIEKAQTAKCVKHWSFAASPKTPMRNHGRTLTLHSPKRLPKPLTATHLRQPR